MSIIYAPTRVTILRNDGDRLAESYGTTASTVAARHVRASIGSPSGTNNILGGDQENISLSMQCDLTEINPKDQVRDEKSGLLYDVVWAVPRTAFPGREHMQVGLTISRGAA